MGRLPRLGLLAHAATVGALLACLRAPLGLDWTQLVAVQATSAALFRAAALLALVLALDPARSALRGGPRPLWLVGLCAGYAFHGLWLDATPGSRAGFALWLLVGTLAARAFSGSRTAEAGPAGTRLGRRESAGLALVGAGAAFALEALAREVRLFTMGTAADEALVGAVFLALVALGALAFGPLLARLGTERVRFPAGIAASAGATLVGLLFLSSLTPDGLFGYLRRMGILLGGLRALDARLGGVLGLAGIPSFDGSSIGTHWTTAILAAAALVAPSFVLGGTLGSSASFVRVRPTALGAAIALLALPHVIARVGGPLEASELGAAPFAWTLVALGAGVGAVGVALATTSLAPSPRERWAGWISALAAGGLPWLAPHLVCWSFSPWAAKRAEPELVWPLAEGLFTVERARGGGKLVSLDRRRLTPALEEEPADERRLRASFALLDGAKPARDVRALFIGQLTPARAAVLASLGLTRVDRTAAWHRAMPAAEARLFPGSPPAGEVLAPAVARGRLGDGEYDWVVGAPAAGPIVTWKTEAREIWGGIDGPRLTDLELEPGTVGVAWIPGDARLERGTELVPLLVSVDRLEHLSLGLARGEFRDQRAALGPLFRLRAAGDPRPLAFLGTMPLQRTFALQRATSAALRCEASEALARGLALHFAAQRLSSPFESAAQQIELDEEALRAFAAALPEALDPLTVEIWEAVAWLCREKRMPEQAVAFLEPVAELHAPWAALDRAMASAYREMLDPEAAQRFLARARMREPEDLWLWIESAEVAEELGNREESRGFLQHALTRPVVRSAAEERALGLGLVRNGDPRGRPLLEKSLLEAPDDPEVRAALGLPPLEGGG